MSLRGNRMKLWQRQWLKGNGAASITSASTTHAAIQLSPTSLLKVSSDFSQRSLPPTTQNHVHGHVIDTLLLEVFSPFSDSSTRVNGYRSHDQQTLILPELDRLIHTPLLGCRQRFFSSTSNFTEKSQPLSSFPSILSGRSSRY